ncbi:hypothetical protein B0919_21665 [Hymenobacter sp. CRA2]|nr:hypothetical protein B0919_21665 [Hymenobacter sp. CRA2]
MGASIDNPNLFANRNSDFWLVKVDRTGAVVWDHSYGGNGADWMGSLVATADGGFLLGGTSQSGVSGDRTQPNSDPALATSDYWIIKVDSHGRKQWDRAYGGPRDESLACILPTAEGGYLLGGSSQTGVAGDRTQPSRGDYDAWLVKIDAQGRFQWDRAYGGAGKDYLKKLLATPDGGLLLTGNSTSDVSGEKSEPGQGRNDYWVVKLDRNYNKQWDRTLGGRLDDVSVSAVISTDSCYVVGGRSWSGTSSDKTQDGLGDADLWLVKLSPTGVKLWDRTYGGPNADNFGSLHTTLDGGFMVSGDINPRLPGTPQPPDVGFLDYWLLKLDANGQQQWDRRYGGNGADTDGFSCVGPDGSYLLYGTSALGTASGDHQAPPGGRFSIDGWLLKLMPPDPAVYIQADSLVCLNGQLRLQALSQPAAATYRWSTGATTSSILVAQPGTYSVTATFADGRTSTARWQVQALAAQPSIGGDTLLCPGARGRLTAVAPGARAYRWNTGATTASIDVSQPGLYSVTAVYSSGCQVTRQQRVRVRAVSTLSPFTLGPDTMLCQGTTLVLQAPAGPGYSYLWSDGSTGATLRVTQPGTYSVGVATACAAVQASRQVFFSPCLNVPNVITPNHDRQNDYFVVQGLSGVWQLEVYSRWGQLVYRSNAYANDWGDAAAAGTYYYVLRQPATGTLHKGWVEVIR